MGIYEQQLEYQLNNEEAALELREQYSDKEIVAVNHVA